MKRFLQLVIIGLFAASCSSTSTLTLSVPQPSNVYLSKEVKNVGIINRSVPNVNYNKLDAIDKILTAEEKNLDRNSAHEAIIGLQNGLKENSRFQNVIVIDSLLLKDYGIDVFSPELKQEEIEKLCSQNNLDAIYELSFYDTDALVSYKTTNDMLPNAFGIKIPTLVHHVTINTMIKSGWRIYDNVAKTLSDQFSRNDNVVISGSGINPIKAYETIRNRKNEVYRISKKIGQNYAYEIIPYTIRESRLYFVKGNSNFEKAQRRAQTGDWDGAGELWETETKNSDAKLAGRAYYNMAIISEINGNLDEALNWASTSYSDYGIKEALQYTRILKSRIQKKKILDAEKL
jgi:hypothetical protein